MAATPCATNIATAKASATTSESPPLTDAVGPDTWRQWSVSLPLDRGEHTLEVRATDAHGMVQTDVTAPPAPDGATGWHRVVVTAR